MDVSVYTLLLSDFLKVAKFQKARNKANAFYMYCHTRILSDGMTYIIRKSKCSTDFKRNDFLKKNEAYPLGALRSLKFAYRKLRISLFVELAV